MRREVSHVALEVGNDGPPLATEMQGQLFTSMVSVRAKQHSSTPHLGTPHLGLGLYIVRLIAEFHSGNAAFANRSDGSGVVATIRLPLA